MIQRNRINKNTKSTKFNFKYENGLLVKPLIDCEFEESYSESQNLYGILVYLSNEVLEKIKNKEIKNFYVDNIKKEIWLDIGDEYMVFNELEDIIIESILTNRLAVCFFTEENTLIKSNILNYSNDFS